jgi:hypothetical protein
MTSKLYFPLNDTRYGFEIFSKHTEKINNNSVGLYPNAEFFIVLINNTSGNVAVSVNINDRLVGTYEVIQHSTYKLINHGELNQFFKFYSEYRDNKNNINFSELKLEWKPIITLYKYIDNPNIKRPFSKPISNISQLSYYDEFPSKYFTQTIGSYDKRINYGCVNGGYPQNTFTTDLNLGISSDKYKLTKQYTSGKQINQKISLIEINQYFDTVNVRDYFVYAEPHLDIFSSQKFDSLL